MNPVEYRALDLNSNGINEIFLKHVSISNNDLSSFIDTITNLAKEAQSSLIAITNREDCCNKVLFKADFIKETKYQVYTPVPEIIASMYQVIQAELAHGSELLGQTHELEINGQHIAEMLSNAYDTLTENELKEILQYTTPGTYLLRKSRSGEMYTISFLSTDKTIKHMRLGDNEGQPFNLTRIRNIILQGVRNKRIDEFYPAPRPEAAIKSARK